MKKSFDPIQFNFNTHWMKEIRALRERPSIQQALDEVKALYAEIAEYSYEDAREFDEEQAKAEYDLELHIVAVRCFNLHWLRETFEGCDLMNLVLAIAEELYPAKSFETLQDDERAVITDLDRTLVFDIKNFDRLSAKASLLLVGDTTFSNDEIALQEIASYLEDSNERTLDLLKELQELTKETSTENLVNLDEHRSSMKPKDKALVRSPLPLPGM